MSTLLRTALGILLIAVGVRDVLHELFHPESSGDVSSRLMRGLWRLMRAISRRTRFVLPHAGPVILVSVAALWAALLTLGWAFVYWPYLDTGFAFDAALAPAETRGLGTAIYFSLTTLVTLGLGDIAPTTPWLRMMVNLESIVGFAMVTAWIAWVVSIHPILAHRRAFARKTAMIRATAAHTGLDLLDLEPASAAQLLRALADEAVRVTSDLRQAPVTYYFQERLAHATLASQLPHLLALTRDVAARTTDATLRHHAALLNATLEDLVAMIGGRHLGMAGAPPDEVIVALARDHLREEDLGALR